MSDDEQEYERSPEEQLEILKAKQDAIEKQAAQDFAEAYQALVDKYGYEVIAQPQYVVNPSTNVFELRMTYMVNKVG